ncbi:MAG: hypothetical protein ABIG68_03250, partial [Acidobacteriota bacterium]
MNGLERNERLVLLAAEQNIRGSGHVRKKPAMLALYLDDHRNRADVVALHPGRPCQRAHAIDLAGESQVGESVEMDRNRLSDPQLTGFR